MGDLTLGPSRPAKQTFNAVQERCQFDRSRTFGLALSDDGDDARLVLC
jgi:hypothetical protein